MRTLVRIVGSIIPALLILYVLLVNVRIYDGNQTTNAAVTEFNEDLFLQLRFLKTSLEGDAGNNMQEIYPEGYVFFYAVYGLAWSNLLLHTTVDQPLYKEGHSEIQRACDSVASPKGRQIFSEYLTMPYGAFYNGWNSYLLGNKLKIEPKEHRKLEEITAFRKACDQIQLFIADNRTPYASSYESGAWPADMMLCVASLKIHDQLFQPKYETTIKGWLKNVKSRLDKNGLIPHAVNPATGDVWEGARGSSQSLMLIFLKEIDNEFAEEQFRRYRKLFVGRRFGLTGIREYPMGEPGYGDVDSGPVMFGFGASASIVGIRTLSLFNDPDAQLLRNGIEAFGIPFQTSSSKRYLLGALPMADAFIAWAYAGYSGRTVSIEPPIWFHIISSAVVMILALLVGIIWGFRLPASTKK